MTDPILFMLAVVTILGTPGPTNTLLATSGATAGVRRSLVLLAGELAGYLIAVTAIRIVLGPMIHAFPLVGVTLKAAVVLYLVWIAVRLWRHDAALTDAGMSISVRSVFITTLLNPKALIFALSILPQQHPALLGYFAAFAATIPAAGFGWILIGRAVGAAAGEQHVGAVRKVASVALVGFAGLIAASALG